MLGSKVWFWNGYGPSRCFLIAVGIDAKFQQRKSRSISPYFRGKNLVALRLRCIIAHKMLFSPSFRCENTTTGCLIFMVKIGQGFMSIYTVCIDMLILRHTEALQNIMIVDACRIHGETNVTRWDKLGQSHCDDRAHNIAWIYTYDNRLERIHILQGQELSWLERVTLIVTRVHHTKCTITHIQVDIDIHTSCAMQSHRVGK